MELTAIERMERDGLRLTSDLAGAESVVARLRPWQGSPVRVASFLPDDFEAYARIPHEESEGSLPVEIGRSLLEVLKRHTGSAACRYCIWDGFGQWWSQSHGFLTSRAGRLGRRMERSYARRAKAQDERLRAHPRVRAEGRSYFLFTGPLHTASDIMGPPWYQSPNLWWPDDEAWCVATEIDARSTYVGGTRACIDAILAGEGLGAEPASPADPLS